MAAADAKPFPLKNVAYRVTFPIFDADGDLVTGAAGLDSEVSLDGGTFADCTNEATEIATNSGMYYLDLAQAEMNADTVAIIVKTSTSGAKTTPIVLYPAENTDIPVNVTAISGDTAAADNLEAATDGGTYNVGGGAVVAASVTGAVGSVTGAVGSVTGAVGSVTGNVGGNVTGSVGSLAAQAKADVNAEVDTALNTAIPGSPTADSINERVATMDGRILGTLDTGTHKPQTGDSYARLGAPAGASVSADVAAVKAQTAAIETDTQDLQTQVGTDGAGLTALPWNAAWDAEVQSEAQDAITASALATAAALATVDDFLDTEVAAILAAVDTEVAAILADTNELQTDWVNGGRLDLLIDAIKAKTDNLPSDPADQSAVEAAITAATSPLATAAALDAVDNYVDSEVAAIKAVTDKLDTALEADSAVYRFTTNALEQAPTGGSAPTAAQIRAEMDANSTQLAAIVADTGTDGVVVAAASKTGYVLAATGLDSITATEPTAKPTTFAVWVMWLVQRYRRADMTASALTIKTEAGATVTTQALSDDSTTQSIGAPS